MSVYPDRPGYKRRGTSSMAAEHIVARAEVIRRRVVELLRTAGPKSPDQAAEALNESILSVRPRFSELVADGWIEETGRTVENRSGRRANVYRLCIRQEPESMPQQASLFDPEYEDIWDAEG